MWASTRASAAGSGAAAAAAAEAEEEEEVLPPTPPTSLLLLLAEHASPAPPPRSAAFLPSMLATGTTLNATLPRSASPHSLYPPEAHPARQACLSADCSGAQSATLLSSPPSSLGPPFDEEEGAMPESSDVSQRATSGPSASLPTSPAMSRMTSLPLSPPPLPPLPPLLLAKSVMVTRGRETSDSGSGISS